MDQVLDEAAKLLARASWPLVYLAPDITCEAQREAVALADAARATLDSVTSATVMGSLLAAQECGRVSATLGEIRNRADVVVFWGVDPADRYPRYCTRCAPEPAGLELPDGRRSRRVVAVDVDRWRGPDQADLRVAVAAVDEVATLTAVSAIVQAVRQPPARYENATSAPWSRAREIAPALLAGRYVALVADAEPDGSGRDAGRAQALIALSQALNEPTRCALSLLRAGGNRSGADAVATWQTGYPAAVDFARGYPRYRPYDGTARERLARGEVDAVLVVGSAALIPAELLTLMIHVPCAVVGPRASESALAGSRAVIDTGLAGIHEAGTALRMDDVPLPLRQVVSGPPAATLMMRALRERLLRH
jgi:formylmethanofuran dehydrogenase subunit B